jgi:hypothetical protein
MKIDWEKSLKVGGAVVGLIGVGYGLYRYENAASANAASADEAEANADEELASNFNPDAAGTSGVEEIPATGDSGESDGTSSDDVVLEALLADLLGPNPSSTNTVPSTTTTAKPTTTARKTTTTAKKTTTTKRVLHTTVRVIRGTIKHTTGKTGHPTSNPVRVTHIPRTLKHTTRKLPTRPTAHP